MHELYQISFAARLAMVSANLLIFLILLNHARNRLIIGEDHRVFRLVLSFAGVSFATFAMLLWSTIITVGVVIGAPPMEFLFSNIITILSVMMLVFAIPLIHVLTVPSRVVWFGSAFIVTSAISGYFWAGEYL